MTAMLNVEPHPLLDTRAFTIRWPQPLGAIDTAATVTALMSVSAAAPMQSNDKVRKAIRDLLRHGGFKPSGRSKPSSEYLRRAAESDRLSAINIAVDIANVVSLHSGLPISVVDMDKLQSPLRVGIAPSGSTYPFNPSGQIIDVSSLLCLFDDVGPCANAVKDAQRTKTDETTSTTLSILWGSQRLGDRTQTAFEWYSEHVRAIGADLQLV